MSYREKANRKQLAAAASARFAELTALLEQQARMRVCRPFLERQLRSGGCDWAGELRGQWPEVLITYLEEGGCPPAELAAVAASLDQMEADLAARIAAFHGDPLADQIMVLAEAAVYVGAT